MAEGFTKTSPAELARRKKAQDAVFAQIFGTREDWLKPIPTGKDLMAILGFNPDASIAHNALGAAALSMPVAGPMAASARELQALGGNTANVLNSPMGGKKAEVKPTSTAANTPAVSMFGAPQTMTGASVDFNTLLNALIQQESGGRPGVSGPPTRYGTAQGLTQMLPSTAQAVAKQHGIPWKPELMTSTTPAGAAYQRQLGSLHFQDLLTQTGGSAPAALAMYHAGPSPNMMGHKTSDYVQKILGRLGLTEPMRVAPFTAPPVAFADPSMLMGMVPTPKMQQRVDLPDAPTLEAPAEMQPYATADKTALLEELRQAMQVAPKDRSRDKWDGIAALLQGMAEGAAAAGPGAPTSQILASAGARGAGQYRNTRASQQAETDALVEQQRQVAITLARMGFDIDLGNLATGNKNLDRKYESGEAARTTRNQNTLNADQRAVQEILQNAGIDQANVEALNANDLTRANVGIGAVGNAAQAQNAASSSQAEMDMTLAQLWARENPNNGGINPQVTNVLLKAQIDPNIFKGNKDPIWQNAEQTAMHVAGRNDLMALGGLANEMVLTGAYASALGEEDVKKVERAIREKNVGGAAAIVANALSSAWRKPKTLTVLMKIIDEMANSGAYPSATIISRNLTRGQTAQQ